MPRYPISKDTPLDEAPFGFALILPRRTPFLLRADIYLYTREVLESVAVRKK